MYLKDSLISQPAISMILRMHSYVQTIIVWRYICEKTLINYKSQRQNGITAPTTSQSFLLDFPGVFVLVESRRSKQTATKIQSRQSINTVIIQEPVIVLSVRVCNNRFYTQYHYSEVTL
ncbi:Hypothetical_protein [Hexamita inflata]|uniref:Hypothetical_protein n=1 Tax=Hexamita inflata TaxID=28002 RepID=A0AA86TKJ2_9EUKA|nr:Hypothetical protein HINF_LOCUS7785 [Hexamita inflata]